MKNTFIWSIVIVFVLVLIYYQNQLRKLSKENAEVTRQKLEAEQNLIDQQNKANQKPNEKYFSLYQFAGFLLDYKIYNLSVGQYFRDNQTKIESHLATKGIKVKGILVNN